jgi:hypothetical protein
MMIEHRKRILGLGLIVLAMSPAAAEAQRTAAAEANGHFQMHHGEVAALMDAMERAHVTLYETLLSEPNVTTDRLDGRFFDETLGRVLAASRGEPSGPAPSTRSLSRSAPRLLEVMQRTYALQRTVYEILSDPTVADPRAAVDRAVDEYLAKPGVALSPVQKSMEIMEAQHGSLEFRERFPKTAGLFWAFRWMQLGGSEPLMVFRDPGQQHGAVEATRERFLEKLADPPANFPDHMPMAPTVAPEMVTRNIRAAAIFDNLNMMHDVIVDALVTESIRDKAGAIEATLDLFTDPGYLQISEIDWIRMSLRHGIYVQGGPAIGRMERPERNETHQHGTGESGGNRMRPPGM